MSDLIIKKNGTDYELPMLAEHYPADRVYLDGDINKTVQDEVNDSGWQNLTTAYTAKYRKKGSIVEIFINSSNASDIPPQTAVTVGILPVGFRPSITLYGTMNAGDTGIYPAYIYINTDGVVQMVNASTSIQRYLFGNITFIV